MLVDGVLEGAGVQHVVDDGLGLVGVALDVQLDHDPGRPLGRMLVEELHRGGDRQLIELESCALVDPLDFAAVLGRFEDGPTGAVLALTVCAARTANVLGDDSLGGPNGSRVGRLAGGKGTRVVAPERGGMVGDRTVGPEHKVSVPAENVMLAEGGLVVDAWHEDDVLAAQVCVVDER